MEIGTINADRTAIGDALSTALKPVARIEVEKQDRDFDDRWREQRGQGGPAGRGAGGAGFGSENLYDRRRHARAGADADGAIVFGRKVYQMQPVDIDEDTLQKIADKTGGKYYRADKRGTVPANLTRRLTSWKKTEAVINKYAQFDELFPWCVSCGLALAADRGGWDKPCFGGCHDDIAD